MYGVFYEDINRAADGGLYAELVQNRSFEYDAADNASYTPLTSLATAGSGSAEVVDDSADTPLMVAPCTPDPRTMVSRHIRL